MSSAWSTGPSTLRWNAESVQPVHRVHDAQHAGTRRLARLAPGGERRGDAVVAVGDVEDRPAQLLGERRRARATPPHLLPERAGAGEVEQRIGGAERRHRLGVHRAGLVQERDQRRRRVGLHVLDQALDPLGLHGLVPAGPAVHEGPDVDLTDDADVVTLAVDVERGPRLVVRRGVGWRDRRQRPGVLGQLGQARRPDAGPTPGRTTRAGKGRTMLTKPRPRGPGPPRTRSARGASRGARPAAPRTASRRRRSSRRRPRRPGRCGSPCARR